MVDQDSHPITPPTPPSPDPRDAEDRADRALVAKIREAGTGSRAVWGELLARYQDRLYGVCLRMVGNPESAADLTQDAFVKVLQGLDTWDGRSRLSTWIIRVTMNVCLSHLRAAKVRRHVSLDKQVGLSPVWGRHAEDSPITTIGSRARSREPEPESGVQQGEEQRRLLAALTGLDPEQRAIIVLRDVQGLDYDQIAAALGVAVGTVKSRLFRARLALRQLVERPSTRPSE